MEKSGCNTEKIQRFIITCLRRILIRWPWNLGDRELWKRTKQKQAEDEILQRHWRWTGHTLRKPMTGTTGQALIENAQGKSKRGRPRHTWCRDLEAETKRIVYTWGQLERLAKGRDAWRDLVGGLCSSKGQRQLFVGCLLNVPATCECISGTDLLRQFYVLPH